ncbi:MAG: SDR family NAD(P)-dependent oxidoreductase [Rhodospirillaceae bacterium]|nr:SDR family NAD(P)-dependent oxidoreductase [Rhodospirillaceae bacterium]
MQAIPASSDPTPRDRGPIRLDGRVALVTGAGRGLGRAHALALAARGAAVVVNDPGVNEAGSDGGSRGPADDVVAEIRKAGGRAEADYGSVSDPAGAEAMVQRAVAAFGSIDIVVNNAGTHRRAVFGEVVPEDFVDVLNVHLVGAFRVSQAAWPHMAKQRRGNIVFTTSQTAFYGKVDSVSYAAAKAGLIGLMQAMRQSAEPLGIKVNCISPFALTRMAYHFPTEIAPLIDPAQAAAAVVLLASDDCPLSGEILVAGGGHFAVARIVESRGIDIDDPQEVTPEMMRRRLAEIGDLAKPQVFGDSLQAVGATFDRLKRLAGIA